MKKIIGLTFVLLLLVIIMFQPTKNLPEEALSIVNELSKDNPDDMDFLKAVWDDLSTRNYHEENCWLKYPSKNIIIDGEKIWELVNKECLPCHQYNNLLQAYLLESGRFTRDQIKTTMADCKKGKVFHLYSIVTLKNGTKINIDAWGANPTIDVKFGQTINDTEICN